MSSLTFEHLPLLCGTRSFVLRTSFIYSIVTDRLSLSQVRVGQERFELSTPRLSSVCSNQLSYWPVGLIGLSRPNSKPYPSDPKVRQ